MSFCGHTAHSPDMPVAIDRMLRAVTLGSPRGQRQWAGEGARLAVADGATLATGPGDRTALLDGEIHNRGDLAAALGIDGRGLSDAGFVLAAHARWGDDYAEHIIGDYACALWDGARRRLVAAVDPGGMHPLLLANAGDGVRFAGEARGLFADPEVDRILDEDRVAHWLAFVPSPPDQTFFRGIQRVPPGGRAVWQDGRLTIGYWWYPERVPMLRLKSHADYADAVRTCLDEAVACRLGTDERVGSHLSGGLDSSSVTALAAARLAAQGRRLAAFTAAPARDVPPPPGRFVDEWPHAAALAAMYPNIDHVRVSNDDMPLMAMIEAREAAQDVPLFNVSNSVWGNGIEREARDRGVTIMLIGGAGNMTFSYNGALLARMLLRRGRIGGLAKTLIDMRRAQNLRIKTLLGVIADAALPPRWAAAMRAAAMGRDNVKLRDFSLITPRFLDASGLTEEAHGRGGSLHNVHPNDSRALRLEALRRLDVQGEFAVASRRLYNVDTRDPTSDRRLIELCLSIPEDQFQYKGLPRAIARTALAGALPRMMLDEQRKGLQAADWAFGFDAAVPGLKAEVARQRASRSLPQWIDLDRVDAMLDGWSDPADGDMIEAVAVTRALAVGRFVRRVEGGNA